MSISDKVTINEVINDMTKSVSDSTLAVMCNTQSFFTLICAEDNFWYDRMKAKNPSLLKLYFPVSQKEKMTYFEFYQKFYNLGILKKIIYPIKTGAISYLLIDTKKNPIVENYPLIEEADKSVTNIVPSDKKEAEKSFIVIPDVMLVKKGDLNYRIIYFDRNNIKTKKDFFDKFGEVEMIIKASAVDVVLADYMEKGLYQVDPDFTNIKDLLIQGDNPKARVIV